MTVREFATSDAIDWGTEFVWVQNTSLLKIIDRDLDAFEVMRCDGLQLRVTHSEIVDKYFEIRNGAYLKPIYAPCMAHVLSSDYSFEIDGIIKNFPEGSAILRQCNSFKVVHKDDLMRDYEAVSAPSDKRFPETPFSR